MMDISQQSFNCDETPTPTRFIRNCEEVGLFQDIQDNPFEETFRIAVQTKRTTESLPEPLSKCVNGDTLDTPQVVPNSKRIEDYRSSYPIIEDDDDEIKIPNNDFLINGFMTQDDDSLSNDDEVLPESLPLIPDIQPNENKNNEPIVNHVEQTEKNVIDLTESPVFEQTFALKHQSVQNGIIEEMFLETHEIMNDDSISNEFLILNNKNDIKENTFSSAVLGNENVIIIPSQNKIEGDDSSIKISSNLIETTSSSIKQKLKKLLKPTQNNITPPVPKIIENIAPRVTSTPPPSCEEISDDKLSYSRERNRMAQKRCRLKKKEWITQLKQDTESVYNENKSLRSELVSLKAEVAHLKTLLLAHKNCPVTLAMYQADLPNVVQNEPPIPQISTLSTNIAVTPIPYAIISATETQNVHTLESKANQNKKIMSKSKKVPVPKLHPIRNSKSVPKSYPTERKQSLKRSSTRTSRSKPQTPSREELGSQIKIYNEPGTSRRHAERDQPSQQSSCSMSPARRTILET